MTSPRVVNWDKYTRSSPVLEITKPLLGTDSTRSRLPPETINERLLMLGNDVTDIIERLKDNKNTEAIRGLDSLTESMKNLIISSSLPGETSETLDTLLDSLEMCSHKIYDVIKQGTTPTEELQNETLDLLQGLQNTLRAYARIDEWKERMTREWGEDHRG